MTDIVQRLREPAECPCGRVYHDDASSEAADEIERLRAEQARARALIAWIDGACTDTRPHRDIEAAISRWAALFESHGYKVEGGSDRPAEAQTAPDGWPEAMAGGRGTRPMDRTPDDTSPVSAPRKDIVQRLREPSERPGCGCVHHDDASAEAADEIERLRAVNAELQEGQLVTRWPLHKMIAAKDAEIERLRTLVRNVALADPVMEVDDAMCAVCDGGWEHPNADVEPGMVAFSHVKTSIEGRQTVVRIDHYAICPWLACRQENDRG